MKNVYEDPELNFPQEDFAAPEGLNIDLRCKGQAAPESEDSPQEDYKPVLDEDLNLHDLM